MYFFFRFYASEETMSLEEFLDFMAKQLNTCQDKREEDLSKEFKLLLQETFHWYDKDADGVISRDELKVRPQCDDSNFCSTTVILVTATLNDMAAEIGNLFASRSHFRSSKRHTRQGQRFH